MHPIVHRLVLGEISAGEWLWLHSTEKYFMPSRGGSRSGIDSTLFTFTNERPNVFFIDLPV